MFLKTGSRRKIKLNTKYLKKQLIQIISKCMHNVSCFYVFVQFIVSFFQLDAEESYILTSFFKYELFSTISRFSSFIGKIISLSDSMDFKLNPSNYDLIYFRKSFCLIESLLSNNILFNLSLALSPTIHSLGFTFDSSLSIISQIKSVAKSSFFHLRRIKQLKLFLENPTFKLLVSSLFFPL